MGSSFLPSELIAAFLRAQLEHADAVTADRMASWDRYHAAFSELESREWLRRPIVPTHCEHNAHMYYVLLADGIDRQAVLEKLKASGISSVFHYVPLHTSPGGQRYGRAHGTLAVTNRQSERLIRLPLWVGMDADMPGKIAHAMAQTIAQTMGNDTKGRE